MFGKRKIAALVAEFIGTGVLTLIILSVRWSGAGQFPLFLGLAVGVAMLLMVMTVGRVSGGHFNPAITIGMWTARKTPTITALCYIVVQFVGAIGAYYLYRYFAASNPQILAALDQKFDTSFHWSVFLGEMVGTAVFAFALASAVYQRFTTAATASVAGLGLAMGSILAATASLGILNPAMAAGSLHVWPWATYLLGPVVGAVVGVNLYALLFAEPVVAEAAAATTGTGRRLVRSSKTVAAPAPAKKATAKKKPARAKKK